MNKRHVRRGLYLANPQVAIALTIVLMMVFIAWFLFPTAGVNGDPVRNAPYDDPGQSTGETRPIVTLTVVDNVPDGVAVSAGFPIDYLFSVCNIGDEPAYNARVTAFVPVLTTVDGTLPWTCGPDPRPTGRIRCDLTISTVEPGREFTATLRAIVDDPLPPEAEIVTLEAVATADNLGVTGEEPWVSVDTPVTASANSNSYLTRVFLPTILQAP